MPIIAKFTDEEWAKIAREVRATAPPFQPPRLFSIAEEMMTAAAARDTLPFRKRRRRRTERDQGDRIQVIK